MIFSSRLRTTRLRLGLDLRVLRQHLRLGRREQAVEAAQHRQRQDDLAVFVPLVRTAEQVADAPDEVGELGVGFGVHLRFLVACGGLGAPSLHLVMLDR